MIHFLSMNCLAIYFIFHKNNILHAEKWQQVCLYIKKDYYGAAQSALPFRPSRFMSWMLSLQNHSLIFVLSQKHPQYLNWTGVVYLFVFCYLAANFCLFYQCLDLLRQLPRTTAGSVMGISMEHSTLTNDGNKHSLFLGEHKTF